MNRYLSALASLGVIALVGSFLTGWVFNIIKLMSIPGLEGHVGEAAIRTIGIFVAPVGAVAGFI